MSQEDLDLLCLAAKACGWEWHPAPNFHDTHSCWLDPRDGSVYWADKWNPLDDPGEALRVAVLCGLHLAVEDNVSCAWQKDRYGNFHAVAHEGNPISATCRAIVRAAAAIERGRK